jgi:hypothetical protein
MHKFKQKFNLLREHHLNIIFSSTSGSPRWSPSLRNQDQLDATNNSIYWSSRSAQHVSDKYLPIIRSVRLKIRACVMVCRCGDGLTVRRAAAWYCVLGVKEDAWLQSAWYCVIGVKEDTWLQSAWYCVLGVKEDAWLQSVWYYVLGVKEDAWLQSAWYYGLGVKEDAWLHTKHIGPRCRPPDRQPTTTTGHHTTCCNLQLYVPDDGQMFARNMLSWSWRSINTVICCI